MIYYYLNLIYISLKINLVIPLTQNRILDKVGTNMERNSENLDFNSEFDSKMDKYENADFFSEREQELLEILKDCEDGVSEQDLDKLFDFKKNERLEILNSLMAKRRIFTMQNKKKELFFMFRSAEDASKYKHMDQMQILIYEVVLESGNKGINTREIKQKTKKTTDNINKYLGILEKQGVIKTIKSVQAKARRGKWWIGSEIEPAIEVVGNIWYTDGEFDESLVQTVSDKCLQYIEKKGQASLKEISIYIRTLSIFQQQITDKEIQDILNILLFDNKIELVSQSDHLVADSQSNSSNVQSHYIYRASKNYIPSMFYLETPCAHCPLQKDCKPQGLINPKECQYIKTWLD
jgi:DNA-directed RNA polymerase III subunit RPC6